MAYVSGYPGGYQDAAVVTQPGRYDAVGVVGTPDAEPTPENEEG